MLCFTQISLRFAILCSHPSISVSCIAVVTAATTKAIIVIDAINTKRTSTTELQVGAGACGAVRSKRDDTNKQTKRVKKREEDAIEIPDFY